jgi:hypothetical protein
MFNWIDRLHHLFIQDRIANGTSHSVRVVGDWPWPIWATIIVIGAVLILTYYCYRTTRGDLNRLTRYALFIIRCVSCAIVLLMLAQWVLVIERVGMPVLAIILDDSMSMQIKDVEPEPKARGQTDSSGDLATRRWDQAVALLCGNDSSALLNELAKKYRVKVYLLDEYTEIEGAVQKLPNVIKAVKPERATTPLGEKIQQVLGALRGQPPVALVILTDGVVNEGLGLEDAARRARQDLVPLYFVGFGAEKGYPDLGLQGWIMENTVFLQDHIALQAQLVAKNTTVKEARVRLTDVTNQRVLAEEKVPVLGETNDFHLIFKAEQAGEIELRLECLPLQGEIDRRNNALSKRLLVREDTIRILMVEDLPRFEYRFLRNALIREPSFELTTVLLGADPEYVEEAKGALLSVPTSHEDLWAYDVIILGDIPANRFSSRTLEDIAAFVTERDPPGGLIILSGPHSMPQEYNQTPLAKVLPGVLGTFPEAPGRTIAGPYQLTPTRDGLTMPWIAFGASAQETEQIWRGLSAVYWLWPLVDLKPGARVLVESVENDRAGRHQPVVVFQYVAAGRVLFHATDETWRWRRLEGLNRYYHYWIEAVRFMARGKLESTKTPQLITDRSEYRAEDPVRIMLECSNPSQLPSRDDSIALWLEYEGQTRREITLQRHPMRGDLFEATLRGLAPGQYYVWVPTTVGRVPATGFVVLPSLKEWESVQMAQKAMETAARLSGGGFYTPSKARQLLDDLPSGRGTLIETLPSQPLWNSSLVLLLLIMTLSAEWILRKRAGLL